MEKAQKHQKKKKAKEDQMTVEALENKKKRHETLKIKMNRKTKAAWEEIKNKVETYGEKKTLKQQKRQD